MVEKLVEGVHHFQSDVFASHKDLFERLGEGQSPDALFVTCSDSRIDPSLLTQANPGELFVLRNAGNLVPAYGVPEGCGAEATIEYAVAALKVSAIVVCGHTQCGAMTGLLHPEKVAGMPSVIRWLECAETTRRIVAENYSHLAGEALLDAAVEENVLVQLENLRTHPSVAAALGRGDLHLYAWVHAFQTGEVLVYDPTKGQYEALTRSSGAPDA